MESSSYTAPRWAWWTATGFGVGRVKYAPGTFGSLSALLAWFGLVFLFRHMPNVALECLLGLLTILMIPVSVMVAGLVVRQIGERDPSFVVFDEWVGMWLALWPAREHVVDAFVSGGSSWKYALVEMFAAFLLFRLFDIWKPWPIRRAESLPGGWGVTLDDVVAGVIAGLMVTLWLTLQRGCHL